MFAVVLFWGFCFLGFVLETLRLLKERRNIENGMKVFCLIQLKSDVVAWKT